MREGRYTHTRRVTLGESRLMEEREQEQPADGQRRRVWAAIRPHAVEPGALGEYVALSLQADNQVAAQTFPSIAAHLATNCKFCRRAAGEIRAFILAHPDD